MIDAAELAALVQAKLPPGFEVTEYLDDQPPQPNDPPYVQLRFTYCDQCRYICILETAANEDIEVLAGDVADQILITPTLDYPEILPAITRHLLKELVNGLVESNA